MRSRRDASPRRMKGDQGASVATVVVLTPMCLVLVMFIVFAGRIATTRQDVLSASRDAARSAAVRSPSAAQAAGHAAAEATLADRDVSCSGGMTIEVDVGDMRPGSQVAATVTCTVSGANLLPFFTPGNKTIEETSYAVVDTYREDTR